MPVVLNLQVTSAIVAWETPPEFRLPIDSSTGTCSICCPIDAINCHHFAISLPIGSEFGRENWHGDRITPTQLGHSADQSAGCNRETNLARVFLVGEVNSIERLWTFPVGTDGALRGESIPR
jgi:hypothetical protein